MSVFFYTATVNVSCWSCRTNDHKEACWGKAVYSSQKRCILRNGLKGHTYYARAEKFVSLLRQESDLFFSQPWFASSRCSRRIIWAELFSRVVSENHWVHLMHVLNQDAALALLNSFFNSSAIVNSNNKSATNTVKVGTSLTNVAVLDMLPLPLPYLYTGAKTWANWTTSSVHVNIPTDWFQNLDR